MKKNFIARMVAIEAEAKAFILSKIPKGESIQLLSNEDAEEQVDGFYDLPVCFDVGKHGDYMEFAIIKVEHTKEGDLLFHTHGKGEDYGKRRLFNTSEISDGVLVTIGDLIDTM
jgi:hypothetical protein